jgi:hypothetical protein
MKRFANGQAGSWKTTDPGDTILRANPAYTRLTSPDDRGAGTLYGYDKPNARIVAVDKATGVFKEQYRVTLDPGWKDLRGMYVVAGADGDPSTVFWIDGKRFYSSVMEAFVAPAASPGPGSSRTPAASRSAGASGAGASGAPSGAATSPRATVRPTTAATSSP